MHQPEEASRKSVAIIGSGMAGLISAYLLTRDKHQRFDVEVFETVRMWRILWSVEPGSQSRLRLHTSDLSHLLSILPAIPFVFRFLALVLAESRNMSSPSYPEISCRKTKSTLNVPKFGSCTLSHEITTFLKKNFKFLC